MSTVTDNQSVRVLFDPDGEGVDFTDNNDMQTVMLEQLLEHLLVGIPDGAVDQRAGASEAWDLDNTSRAPSFADDIEDLILTRHPGCAFAFSNGGARQIQISAGPVLTAERSLAVGGRFDGTVESAAPFWFGGSDTLTTDIGDANPRIDIVEMKFEYVDSDPDPRSFEDATTGQPTTQVPNKRRRVQATLQIKKGVAASTPSYPTCSSGFAPLLAIWIPALHNTVHSAVNIRDMRWPVGRVYAVDTLPTAAWYPGATPWTLSHGNPPDFSAHGPGSGSGDLYLPCPVTSRTARVVGIGLYGNVNGGSAHLQRINYTAAGPTFTDLLDTGTSLVDSPVQFSTISAIAMMDLLAGASSESKGTRQSGSRNGTPIWCNGYSAGPAIIRGAAVDLSSSGLVLKVHSVDSTDRLWFVRWFLAE
jgi:hypothetical protein